MVYSFFHTFFYNPIYNGLVFLISYFSWMDVGIAVVVLTILVKLILSPLTRKSIEMQIKIKEIEPEMERIKEKYKNDKERLSKEILFLYKNKKINPFFSIFLLLIQIPVLFGLYFVFLRGDLLNIDSNILYSFVKIPEHINVFFLGVIDVTEKSLFLAVLAGISQYFQFKITAQPIKIEDKSSLKNDLMKSMQFQMKFIMPFFIFIISYQLASAVALYWVTSNIFNINQELLVRRNKGKN